MNEQELIWKDIPGTNGKYSLTRNGDIRNNYYRKTGKAKIAYPGIYGMTFKEKYLTLDLIDENGELCHSTKRVADLVYETFVGPLDGMRLIPKDGDWMNVCLDNLEPVTRRVWVSERKKASETRKYFECEEKMKNEESEPEKESCIHEVDINSFASTLEEFIRNKILYKLQLSEFRCSITFQEGTMDVEEIKFTRKQ